MPVQILCTSVVIRNDALDRVLEGGAAEFGSIAPNAMSYSDNCLSQASFMSPVDAEEFAKSLEMRGLERNKLQPDFVIVQAHDNSIAPSCDWLILFEFEQRLVATMRGNESRKLIAPAGHDVYDSSSIQHYSAEEVERRFEFVERKDSIDTYRDKESGQFVYHTRKTETFDEIFRRTFDTVWKLHREPGTAALDDVTAKALSQPIAELQSLIAKHPDAANVHLALGMAWFSIGELVAARRHCKRASQLDPTNTVILKELGGVCIEQGDFAGAVAAGTKAVAVSPDNPELLGNLSVGQLLAGDAQKAKQTIVHALSLEPSDPINRNIQYIIEEVIRGRRKIPSTLIEMMTPPPKKSLLSKLLRRK